MDISGAGRYALEGNSDQNAHFTRTKEMPAVAAANNKTECLCQNLLDAKCSEALRRQCIALSSEGQSARMIPLLKEHRKELLDTIHKYQKALDSLDYLLFRTEKEHKQGTTL